MRWRLLIAFAVISCNDNTAKEDTTLADPPKDPVVPLLVLEANAAAPRVTEPQLAAPHAAEPNRAAPSGSVPDHAAASDAEQTANGAGSGSAKVSVNTIGDVLCKVTLGSHDLGGAPVFKRQVPAGDYVIAIDCPSGRRYRAQIVLKDGDDTKVVVRPDMWQSGPPLPHRDP